MTVECDRSAIYLYLVVPLDNHAIVVARLRASTFITHACNSAAHNNGFVLPRHNLSTVAGGVAYTNYAAHERSLWPSRDVTGPCLHSLTARHTLANKSAAQAKLHECGDTKIHVITAATM
ncbi:hypothetical protein GCM10027093_03120 [Paraburkholderia jirisanensis]